MSKNNYFRGSIYHCLETSGNLKPAYFEDGLMVVEKESGKIVEALHNELKEEKEKVKNLAEWKSQLSDKNKELKQENEKYV